MPKGWTTLLLPSAVRAANLDIDSRVRRRRGIRNRNGASRQHRLYRAVRASLTLVVRLLPPCLLDPCEMLQARSQLLYLFRVELEEHIAQPDHPFLP